MKVVETRYNRNELLFGTVGQRAIGNMRVGVIGLGGLGSPAAQDLAYLGVVSYVLIDNDRAGMSSLNRVIGLGPHNVASAPLKVDNAQRLIRAIQPDAQIVTVPHPFEHEQSRDYLRAADILVGCVDNDLTRLHITEYCARLGKPYIDLATDIDTSSGTYGGHVVFSGGGERCLQCLGLLDQRELSLLSADPSQRELHERLYGVRRGALNGTGPAVVSLNATIAGLGVTEFMVWATGLRAPKPHLDYRADRGTVRVNMDPPAPSCYYCKGLWQQELER